MTKFGRWEGKESGEKQKVRPGEEAKTEAQSEEELALLVARNREYFAAKRIQRHWKRHLLFRKQKPVAAAEPIKQTNEQKKTEPAGANTNPEKVSPPKPEVAQGGKFEFSFGPKKRTFNFRRIEDDRQKLVAENLQQQATVLDPGISMFGNAVPQPVPKEPPKAIPEVGQGQSQNQGFSQPPRAPPVPSATSQPSVAVPTEKKKEDPLEKLINPKPQAKIIIAQQKKEDEDSLDTFFQANLKSGGQNQKRNAFASQKDEGNVLQFLLKESEPKKKDPVAALLHAEKEKEKEQRGWEAQKEKEKPELDFGFVLDATKNEKAAAPTMNKVAAAPEKKPPPPRNVLDDLDDL